MWKLEILAETDSHKELLKAKRGLFLQVSALLCSIKGSCKIKWIIFCVAACFPLEIFIADLLIYAPHSLCYLAASPAVVATAPVQKAA